MNPRDTTSRERVQKFHAYDMLPQPLIGQSQIKRNTLWYAFATKDVRKELEPRCAARSCFWDHC